MKNRTFIFSFDELPLVIDLGFNMGRVSGQAEIAYTDDVTDFEVTDVWLHGDKPASYTEEQKFVARHTGVNLPLHIFKMIRVHDDVIYSMIVNRLENECSAEVCEGIREEIEAERQYRRDEAADDRRNDWVAA